MSDRIIAFCGLAIALPVIALTYLWIRVVSSDEVLHYQARVRGDGLRFDLINFRTFKRGENKQIPGARFIRWCRLDQLPQLVNVLRGDFRLSEFMSDSDPLNERVAAD